MFIFKGGGQKCNRHHGNELKLGIGLRMSRTHLKMTSPPSVHVRIAPKVREGPGGLGVNKSSVGVNDVTFGRCRAHNVYFLPPQIRFPDLETCQRCYFQGPHSPILLLGDMLPCGGGGLGQAIGMYSVLTYASL